MQALDIYFLPGSVVLRLLLAIAQIPLEQTEPQLFLILAFFVSWVIWAVLIRTAWQLTKRIFNLY